MSEQIIPYSPTHYISIDIRKHILQRSKTERFYIMKPVSTFYPSPEPILYLLGSFSNEYKLCFSKDMISCSCDYSHSFPCKHLLFIFIHLHVKIRPGPMMISPYEILQLLSECSLHLLFLDKTTDKLCSSHRSNGSLCNHYNYLLDRPISTCFHCSRSFHFGCLHAMFNCPSWSTLFC